MKKVNSLILILLISTFTTNIFAEWKFVTQSEDEQDMFYLDFDRIKKHNGKVLWWDLRDSGIPNGKYYSVKSYQEGDCDYLRYKILTKVFYEGRMGTGKQFSPDVPAKYQGWQYAKPGTVYERVFLTACRLAK